MGTKYATIASSGYDSTPPADDGTVSEANKVKWSTIKTKLSGPVKTLADAINTALVTHFDNGPRALTGNTTLGASDYGKIIQVSGSGVTLTLTDAATLTAGWYCRIVNTDASNTIAIARATGADTINASAANITLGLLSTIDVFVIAAATGFRAITYATAELGLVKLTSGTVTNSASLDLVMTSYTTYRNKLLVVNLIPATDGVALYAKVSTNGGSSYDATGCDVASARVDSSASTVTGSFGNGNNQITVIGILPDGIGNGSDEGLSMTFTLYDTINTAVRPRIKFAGSFVNSAATPRVVSIDGAGMRATAQDTDAFQLLFSSGNITSGTYALYGFN